MRVLLFLVIVGSVALAACGNGHHTSAQPTHATASRTLSAPVTTVVSSPAPSPSASSPTAPSHSTSASLITNKKANRKVCKAFATEQNGQITADQFNIWLLQHGNAASNKLINNLADWFVNQSTNPQQAEGYVAMVFADCGSIHVLF